MRSVRWGSFFLLLFAAAAQAQTSTGAVRESTDPARVAAVERAAAELQSLPPQKAFGVEHGRTASGYETLSGGISPGDRVKMHAQRDHYSLWVATVAKPSGAYLADVDLRIVNAKTQAVVLDRQMEGPWLFVKLPAGQYNLSATFHAADGAPTQTLNSQVAIANQGLRQAVLRFDSNATVGPEMRSPFNGNPFAAPVASAAHR